MPDISTAASDAERTRRLQRKIKENLTSTYHHRLGLPTKSPLHEPTAIAQTSSLAPPLHLAAMDQPKPLNPKPPSATAPSAHLAASNGYAAARARGPDSDIAPALPPADDPSAHLVSQQAALAASLHINPAGGATAAAANSPSPATSAFLPKVEQLSYSNYTFWFMSVQLAAALYRCDEHVVADTVVPADAEGKDMHRRAAAQAWLIITQSVPEEIRHQLTIEDLSCTPHRICEKLKEVVMARPENSRMYLMSRAQNTILRSGDCMTDYISAHDDIRQRMILVDHIKEDDEATTILFILCGLRQNSDFTDLYTALSMKSASSSLTLTALKHELLREEQYIKTKSGVAPPTQNSTYNSTVNHGPRGGPAGAGVGPGADVNSVNKDVRNGQSANSNGSGTGTGNGAGGASGMWCSYHEVTTHNTEQCQAKARHEAMANKWCSFHETSTHDTSECKAKARQENMGSKWCSFHESHSHNTEECEAKRRQEDYSNKWCSFHESHTHNTDECQAKARHDTLYTRTTTQHTNSHKSKSTASLNSDDSPSKDRAAEKPTVPTPLAKRLRRLVYHANRLKHAIHSRRARLWPVLLLATVFVYLVYRQVRLYALLNAATASWTWLHPRATAPDRLPRASGSFLSQLQPRGNSSAIFTRSSEASVNLWRRVDANCPAERDVPPRRLYATGAEACYAVGLPKSISVPRKGDPASFWQMNSRAFCYNAKPMCIYGRAMNNLLSFDPRGSSSCHVVSVKQLALVDARSHGLNESCAAFRRRYIADIYGREIFADYNSWLVKAQEQARPPHAKHMPVYWASSFAIVVPKYPWSYNICHYNRIWNFIIWIIRNLKLFIHDVDPASIRHIHIFFRVGYRYNMLWHTGLREATVGAMEKELGLNITVTKLRFNPQFDYQCIHRGIWLGREGRVDSFPFFNDSEVWSPEDQRNDTHWPHIPHQALWLRQAVARYSGVADAANYSTEHPDQFSSIPVPPRRVAVLQRSPYSKRRLTARGNAWFDLTLRKLCLKHNMKLSYVRTSAAMPFKDQAGMMRNVGVAVGLHGANMVNTMFMPAAGSLFEIFPWRYVRFYYAAGSNSGLRYSFHEPRGGVERHCQFSSPSCFFKYRESLIYITAADQREIYARLDKAIGHVAHLHEMYPGGVIPLTKDGDLYHLADR